MSPGLPRLCYKVRVVKPGHLKLSCLTNGGVTIYPSSQPVTPMTPTSPPVAVAPPRTNPVVGHDDDDDADVRMQAAMEEDPDFDPDNMVIRGAPLEDDDD